jgi:hypothetical protein
MYCLTIFSLNAIHSQKDRKKGDPFTAYDSLLIDTCNVSGNKFIQHESLSILDLEMDIKERLHRYFDPLKINPVQHILANISDVKGNTPDVIILCREIRAFLNTLINESV